MRLLASGEITTGVCILVLAVSASLSLGGSPASSGCDEGVHVQIATDKRVYAQGAAMHVKFLVTNTDETPLYLFSAINQCSSPLGWLSLRIRDQHNQQVSGFDCAVDYLMDELNPVRELSDSRSGVLLRKGEIFGRVQEYILPKKRGIYRLQAEIGQVGFLTEEQKGALSKNQMRILHCTCSSPIVTVEIK